MRRNTLKTTHKKNKWDDLLWFGLLFVMIFMFGYMGIGALEWQMEIEAGQNRQWYEEYKKVVPPECDIVRNAYNDYKAKEKK